MTMSARVSKLEILAVLTLGTLTALVLNVCFNVVWKPEHYSEYLWLSRLQEPGTRTGEWVLGRLQPLIGYPWNVRCAIVSAYSVMIAIWALPILAVLVAGRAVAGIFKFK